ncbi:MAG: hypothetical protein F6K54_26620 [Okeania sp. SIO3B5]|uniref:hypothetical protein n=1 Tax=Okeania sp. SIO3B5 TaxID=2607811 RepID=UPI0013FE89E0|nr:hypothetical protein [Okeania sp. SIO3B5]NEO56342.1 hypothetical protein [Okeania sp. SIO3B5]
MFSMEEFKKSRLYRGMKRLAREEITEENRQKGRQEGREEGILLTKLQVVPMFLELGLTVEEIAQRLELTVEQVQQAAQNNE